MHPFSSHSTGRPSPPQGRWDRQLRDMHETENRGLHSASLRTRGSAYPNDLTTHLSIVRPNSSRSSKLEIHEETKKHLKESNTVSETPPFAAMVCNHSGVEYCQLGLPVDFPIGKSEHREPPAPSFIRRGKTSSEMNCGEQGYRSAMNLESFSRTEPSRLSSPG